MKVRLTLTGVEPLLMHSDRLSDPLDPHAMALREVSSKRKKTDDDHREMARLSGAGASTGRSDRDRSSLLPTLKNAWWRAHG